MKITTTSIFASTILIWQWWWWLHSHHMGLITLICVSFDKSTVNSKELGSSPWSFLVGINCMSQISSSVLGADSYCFLQIASQYNSVRATRIISKNYHLHQQPWSESTGKMHRSASKPSLAWNVETVELFKSFEVRHNRKSSHGCPPFQPLFFARKPLKRRTMMAKKGRTVTKHESLLHCESNWYSFFNPSKVKKLLKQHLRTKMNPTVTVRIPKRNDNELW